jgi:hypothetical protein
MSLAMKALPFKLYQKPTIITEKRRSKNYWKAKKQKRTFAITADRRDNMKVRQIQTLHGHNMGFVVLCKGRWYGGKTRCNTRKRE